MTVTIPAEHAARYRECGAVMFPMEPQPEMTLNDTGRFWQWDGPDIVVQWDSHYEEFPAEYAVFHPGDEIVFEWEEDRLSHDGFHSGQRIRRTVSSVTSKRLGELTEREIDELAPINLVEGLGSLEASRRYVIEQWNREHPDHPWSSDRWAWLVGLEETK